jgi:hypothetical protein
VHSVPGISHITFMEYNSHVDPATFKLSNLKTDCRIIKLIYLIILVVTREPNLEDPNKHY